MIDDAIVEKAIEAYAANSTVSYPVDGPAMRAALEAALSASDEEPACAAKYRGQGMAIAAGILVKGIGEETYAAEIMGAAGYKSIADLEADGVDEYDINILRPLFETAAP